MYRRSDHRESVSPDIELDIEVAHLRAQLRRVERENRNLRGENEVLREAADPLIHQAPARERFAFIYARRDRFSVKLLCRILVTDRGSYYAWVRARGSGVTRRRRRNLTKPDKGASAVPDLIRRRFTAPMPGLKLIGDISCFRTGEGWLYLATAVDLCSKEVLGYAIAPHMRAGLAVEAINAAHRTGLVAGNAIMHTDRGSQYHSREYKNALRRLEIRQSTSRTGSCLDGAAAESFFATIKAEIGAEPWPNHAAARRDIENWIKSYNERRLHSSLGYRTPIESRIAWQQRMSMAA